MTLSPWYQTYSLFQYLGIAQALPSSRLLGGDTESLVSDLLPVSVPGHRAGPSLLLGGDTESLVPDLLPVSVSGHGAGPSQFPATRR